VQQTDLLAGSLSDGGALGGALQLSQQVYYPGINDVLGADPTGAAFNSSSMTLFDSWTGLSYANAQGLRDLVRITARKAIAAGETLFNTLPINITNVRGLNDNAALGKPTTLVGHCTTCHDAPNVGDHSLPLPLDIGTGHSTLASMEPDPQIEAGLQQLNMPDLPIYAISGCPDPEPDTGAEARAGGVSELVVASDLEKCHVDATPADAGRHWQEKLAPVRRRMLVLDALETHHASRR
jgi:cytochrome c peroxidase